MPESRREQKLTPDAAFSPPVRCQLRGIVDEKTERFALRAVLATARLLGLATGTHLRQLRETNDPLLTLQAQLEEARLHARLSAEVNEILHDRFAKIPERHRPYYTPAQRFRILEIKNLLGWNQTIAARVFLVCPNTIANWERSADPHARTVGSTVKPNPPVRRFADAVRASAQLLLRCGMGHATAALVLARAGWRVSTRSVARIARERPQPTPAPDNPQPARNTRPVVARFANHTWMMDVTQIRSLFGGQVFHLAGVFDAFSRAPLALQLSTSPPHGSDTARLLKRAVCAFGQPKYLITDRGPEFRSLTLQKTARRLGILQRFASAENIYATARLERFWRALKDTASLRLLPPLTLGDLERRLETALLYYLVFRPHQGLQGATPAEAFLGTEPACHKAKSPPRARSGHQPTTPPFTIEYLEPENRRFPVLKPAA